MMADLIYDVGLHLGEDTAYYLGRGFRVVGVEADPDLVQRARRRFARAIAGGRLILVHAAITEADGRRPFWRYPSRPEWNAAVPPPADWPDAHRYQQIEVPSVRFRSLLQTHGVPWYLKIDIESCDHLCIQDLDLADLPMYVSYEAGQTESLRHLHALGYRGFKCISQMNYLAVQDPPSPRAQQRQRLLELRWDRRWWMVAARALGLKLWLRRRLQRQRRDGWWQFPQGAAGPTSDRTDGRWLPLDELLAVHRRHIELQEAGVKTVYGDLRQALLWADFHARLGDGQAADNAHS